MGRYSSLKNNGGQEDSPPVKAKPGEQGIISLALKKNKKKHDLKQDIAQFFAKTTHGISVTNPDKSQNPLPLKNLEEISSHKEPLRTAAFSLDQEDLFKKIEALENHLKSSQKLLEEKEAMLKKASRKEDFVHNPLTIPGILPTAKERLVSGFWGRGVPLAHHFLNKNVCIILKHKLIFMAVFLSVAGLMAAYLNWPKPDNDFRVVVQGINSEADAGQDKYSISNADIIIYLKSYNVLRKIIEKFEKLPNDPTRREQLINTLVADYRQRIRVEPVSLSNEWSIYFVPSAVPKQTIIIKEIASIYKALTNALKQYDEDINRLKEAVIELEHFKPSERVVWVNRDDQPQLEELWQGYQEELKQTKEVLQNRYNQVSQEISRAGDDSEKYYPLSVYRFKLVPLEFEKNLLDRSGDSVKKINELKAKAADTLKQIMPLPLTVDQESELSLYLKKLFLSARLDALDLFLGKQFGEPTAFSVRQKEYYEKIKTLNGLLINYENSFKKKREFRAMLDKIKIRESKPIQSSNIKHKFDGVGNNMKLWMLAAGLGLFLACAACFLREKIEAFKTSLP